MIEFTKNRSKIKDNIGVFAIMKKKLVIINYLFFTNDTIKSKMNVFTLLLLTSYYTCYSYNYSKTNP